MEDETVDLIYLDPPFFSGKNYEVIWGDEAEIRSFDDRFEGGIMVYVEWMKDRLVEMHRILKSTGSIYLHVDWHAVHYLKVEMDKIFGYNNFKNNITWKRTHAHNDSKQFGRNCDNILFYTKSKKYTFNVQHSEYDQTYIDNFFKGKDERGVYRLVVFTGPHVNKNDPAWKGYIPAQSGRSWSVPKRIVNSLVGEEKAKKMSIIERLNLLNDNNYVIFSKNGIPSFKQYIDDMPGVPLQEVWDDIPVLSSQSKERLGYPTQKPEALLDRIIKASSNPGDIVFDSFCGCGTTVAVAQKLKRQYIGIDISPIACKLIATSERVRYPIDDIIGLPRTVEEISIMEPHEFQNWVCQKMSARNTSPNAKTASGADGGVDGTIQSPLTNPKYHKAPIQVKRSTGVGINTVKNFFATMHDLKRDVGFIVALSFGSGAREQVATYRNEGSVTIHLLTVEDIIDAKDLSDITSKLKE